MSGCGVPGLPCSSSILVFQEPNYSMRDVSTMTFVGEQQHNNVPRPRESNESNFSNALQQHPLCLW
jgi:hypothetical protein